MHPLAGSAFAPDTASDWWNFGVNVLIGIATLAALVIAIRQANQATLESMQAQAAARRSEEREAAREAAARLEDVRRRAARQATAISVSPAVVSSAFGPTWLYVDVRNDSEDMIREIFVVLNRPEAKPLKWDLSNVKGRAVKRSASAHSIEDPRTSGLEMALEVEFTDVYRDRWCINSLGQVELIRSASVVDREQS